MNDKIFRKKSIDRMSSPEQLNDYIKVTNPGVWMVLAAIVILLVGVCVWGVFGKLETKLSVAAVSQDGSAKFPQAQRHLPSELIRGISSTSPAVSTLPMQSFTKPEVLPHPTWASRFPPLLSSLPLPRQQLLSPRSTELRQ